MKISFHRFLPALITVLLSCPCLRAEEPAQKTEQATGLTKGLELFDTTILPALEEHCYSCHSNAAEVTEGGLELDSPAGLLRGGDSGPMLKAHDSGQSRLLDLLQHNEDVSAMPPEEKLPEELIAAFGEWIRLGAPDSRKDIGPTAKEQRLEESKQHWAFQPPTANGIPAVVDTEWAHDPGIDNFVLAQIESEGIHPVGDADRRTLIRRLFFDLVGLPPTPEEIDAFVADKSPEAVELLVDRLLASPQFGERWGRHWLDVVRFAESSGMEFNFTYPHAWPYRNYVIDSFNADKPFDVFLREQVAGDLMSAVDGESPEAVEARNIAPSLLSFGPKRHNSSGTGFRMDIADDQIDVIFKSMQAMTVSCARCHDHKFDPIPTKDYYSLAGIFMSTEPLYGTIKQKYSNTPTDLLPIGNDAQAKHDAAEAHKQKITEAEKSLTEQKAELKKATDAQAVVQKQKTESEGLLAAISARRNASSENADASELDIAKSEDDQLAKTLAEHSVTVASLTEAIKTLTGQIDELKKTQPTRPHYAMSVRDRAKPADIKVAVRGELGNAGYVAPRGFLSAVNVPDAAPVDVNGSGRMELANWIANSKNPLTARVMVNRIWHHLFGRGIVSTVDNFGLIGKPPTHPELLDTLAIRFVEGGWSVKKTIRSLVLSRAYQLSSQSDDENASIDPDNRYFWRASPRRLEAETIRDAILSVSGQLNLERPEGSTVTSLGDQMVRGIAPEKIQPASRHRSVYLPVVRDYVPEMFDQFDFPSPSLVTGNRAVTNVPSQALYLRNSQFVAEQARFAAQRLLAVEAAADDNVRVDLSMNWALGRIPSDAERAATLQFITSVRGSAAAQETSSDRDEKKEGPSADVAAWSAWFLTLFSTAEFRYLVDIAPETGASSL